MSAARAVKHGAHGEKIIRITGNKLPVVDWEFAQLWIEPKPGCCVVEMAPVPERTGHIYVPNTQDGEWRNRPDYGTIIASSSEVPYDPGTVVIVNHEHGKRIEGAVFGPWEPANEVRIYGRACQSGQGSIYVPWYQSILGELVSLGTLEEPGVIIRPTWIWVLIERDGMYEKSDGGIEIPDVAKHGPGKGTVISAGPWAGIVPTADGWKRVDKIERGMRVTYSTQNIRRFECPGVDNRRLVLVRYDDVLAEIFGEELSAEELAALPMTDRGHHPNDDIPLNAEFAGSTGTRKPASL